MPRKPYIKKRHRKKTPFRACRLCGKDAYPNYFFCRACHQKISPTAKDDVDEHSWRP